MRVQIRSVGRQVQDILRLGAKMAEKAAFGTSLAVLRLRFGAPAPDRGPPRGMGVSPISITTPA